MLDCSKPSMILFARSDYYDLQLIITKYILAELIILFAVNIIQWEQRVDRSVGMCWDLLLLWLQQIYGGSASGGWLRWRLESHNGMVRYGRPDNYDSVYGVDSAPSGKGWVAAETQKTNDWQLLEFFTVSSQLKCSMLSNLLIKSLLKFLCDTCGKELNSCFNNLASLRKWQCTSFSTSSSRCMVL